MSVTTSENCPSCKTSSYRMIYPKTLDPITLDSFSIAECSSCKLTYTSPRPFSLDRYYPEKYRGYGRLVRTILHILYNHRVSKWIKNNPHGGSVLEIGCGPGLMLAAFKRRGWQVLGIERNENIAKNVQEAHGIDVLTRPIETLPLESTFDLIILFHVLEHIAEPEAMLRECAERLSAGGRVIINVPNFASWQSRFAGSEWLHLDPPRHLIHFTPQTLNAMLDRTGLKPDNISFASPEHDPYGWIESLINRLTGNKNRLTRFLMGIDPFDIKVALSFTLGTLLLLPAIALSTISWLARKGALMEVVAVKKK